MQSSSEVISHHCSMCSVQSELALYSQTFRSLTSSAQDLQRCLFCLHEMIRIMRLRYSLDFARRYVYTVNRFYRPLGREVGLSNYYVCHVTFVEILVYAKINRSDVIRCCGRSFVVSFDVSRA